MMVTYYTLLKDGDDGRMFHHAVVSRLVSGNRKDSSLHSWVLLEEGAHRTDFPFSKYCFSYRIVVLL